MQAAVFSFTRRGAELSKIIAGFLADEGYEVINQATSKYAAEAGLEAMEDHNKACAQVFNTCQTIVYIGAVGIAVRTIAPYIKSKLTDPAVISVDERGKFVIPLLAGHIGGANEMARAIALKIGGTPCVTTATDVNSLFAVDEWAARNNCVISSLKAAKDFAADLVNNKNVGLVVDPRFKVVSELPKQVASFQPEEVDESVSSGMVITLDNQLNLFESNVRLMPKIVHLGIGCRRNTPLENIEALVLMVLEQQHLDIRCVVSLASVDLKKDEAGLLAFAEKYRIGANFYTAEELNALEGDFTPSAFVKSIVGVSNVCERSAVLDSKQGRLIVRKTSLNGVTCAIAVEDYSIDFNKTGLKK